MSSRVDSEKRSLTNLREALPQMRRGRDARLVVFPDKSIPYRKSTSLGSCCEFSHVIVGSSPSKSVKFPSRIVICNE